MESAATVRTALLRCLLIGIVVAPCSRAEAGSKSAVDPRSELSRGPRLVWSDPDRLFPFGLEQLSDELSALFREIGAEVKLDPGGATDHRPQESSLRVSVMREPKPYWRLRGDVMAAAPRAEGSQGTIYVFLEQVQRVLGHLASSDPSEVPRENAELARALARILAHEVVHAVAPAHPHATSGLMVARLRRASLLRRRVQVDPLCARAFRAALDGGERRPGEIVSTPR